MTLAIDAQSNSTCQMGIPSATTAEIYAYRRRLINDLLKCQLNFPQTEVYIFYTLEICFTIH